MMQVHLIRSHDFSSEAFEMIQNVLQSKAGLISFIGSKVTCGCLRLSVVVEKDLDGYNSDTSWQNFNDFCTRYRNENGLSLEDVVVLLTPEPLFLNWFTAFDDEKNNIFIRTDEWEKYLHCSPVYPVAYLVMAQVLQKALYKSTAVKLAHTHDKPEGCINDFCSYKKDITFKLRTADICVPCLEQMVHAGLKPEYITQALSLFDVIRQEMLFRQRYKLNLVPKSIAIKRNKGRKKGIVVELLESKQLVELNPTQSLVYLFFLNHPEGVILSKLMHTKYRKELLYLYANLTNRSSKSIDSLNRYAGIENTIDSLVTDDAILSPIIAKVKKLFIDKIGLESAKVYYIQGEKSMAKKINLDRTMITFDQDVINYVLGPYHFATAEK